MDMTGVELLVANAHRQVQRVEDEVIREMKDHMEDYKNKNYVWSGSVTSRLDDLELAKERTNEKCESIQEVLTSWMVTFEALEMSMGSISTRIQAMEDHLVDRSRSLREFTELVLDQAATIRLLQERVRELELSHGVLRARVINIEVRRSMVASLCVLTVVFL
jgi:chromosome segregation ATPase